MRRRFQQGYVFQKGRKKLDPWLPTEPAYVQFWRDAPGEPQRREVVALGTHRTRTRAERKAAETLEKLGINSTQHFIESTSSVTFRQQGEVWLHQLQTRKRNPIESNTIEVRRYALDKWHYTYFGAARIADITNRSLKDFAEHLVTACLSPSTIREYVQYVKSIVASAIDDNGEELFPRKWNDDFIDVPPIGEQRQPSVTADAISSIVREAEGQERVLYALLAGCGPLRIGEALGLEVRHISPDFRTLSIRQSANRGIIKERTKTVNGIRDIDVCASIATMLRDFIGDRTEGLLFHSPSGNQLLQSNILFRSLHPILTKLGLPKGGFNIFRRFRRTYLDTTECPESLKHFWTGHAPRHVSERYIKLGQQRDFRLEWAERVGTGFELPVGPLGQLIVMRRTA